MVDTTLLDTTDEIASPNGTIDWLDPEDELAMRQLIFQAQDIKEEIIPVREWRLKVLVRGMTGIQRAQYLAIARDQAGAMDFKRMYFDLVQMCCLHPKTRKPIFKVADRQEVLFQKNGAILDMLASAVIRLSQLDMGSQDIQQKNSEAIQSSTATTNLPNGSDTRE